MNIKSVKIKGFRGIKEEKIFEFQPESPLIILYGDNGKGKSSVLNSIEWCLFGSECIGKATGIRERIDWEIKNRNSDECIVEICFTDGNEEYIIKRKLVSPKKKDELEIRLPTGEIKKDENAVYNLLRMGFRDFLIMVYQHQENIRAVLTQEPKDRNEALDRLFGLSDYRNIIEGIKKITGDELEKELESIKNQIKAKIDVWNQQIEDKKEELRKEGISEDKISKNGASEIAKEIIENLTSFSEKIGLPLSPNISGLVEIKTENIREIKNEIGRLRSEMPDIKKQEELYTQQNKFARLKNDYDSTKKDFEEIRKKLHQFEEEKGNKEVLEKKKLEIESSIKEIEKEKEKISLKGKTIEDAIKYLMQEGIDKSICPVCGAEKMDLLTHLQEEWEKNYRQKMQEFNDKIDNAKRDLDEIQRLISQHNDLLNENEKRKKVLDSIYDNIVKILAEYNIQLTSSDDPSLRLNKEIIMIKEELKGLEEHIKSKQKELNEIENKVILLEKIYGILELESKREKAREIENTPEWSNLKNLSEKYKKFSERIGILVDAVQEASSEEAREKIESNSTRIKEYFKKITEHPLVKAIKIEVSRSRTGFNEYEFKDEENKEITPILNQGAYNALALSIFLSMSENHKLGFIILDDPSQSLGSIEKERFSEVVNEILQKKTVFLSTMDKELYEFLKSHVTKRKMIYEFKSWNPENGPDIEEIS